MPGEADKVITNIIFLMKFLPVERQNTKAAPVHAPAAECTSRLQVYQMLSDSGNVNLPKLDVFKAVKGRILHGLWSIPSGKVSTEHQAEGM